MPVKFLGDSFLIHSKSALRLYREYAAPQPIFDYHSHLPVREIAENQPFNTITEMWLAHDHYKWRAMRANGVDERFITGDSSDKEKFLAWAETVPRTVGNPLYHWTHMELSHYFGLGDVLLNGDTAEEVYRTCNELLKRDEFRPRSLIDRMNVSVLCTTDDPTDSLEYHRQLQSDEAFPVTVLPTFRPDRSLGIEHPESFNAWISRLESVAGFDIRDFDSFIQALQKRHDQFHDAGCRASDHGLEEVYTDPYTESEINSIFRKVRRGEVPEKSAVRKFKTCMLAYFAWMNQRRDWVQMLHLGAHRNSNTRFFNWLGPDSGFDSIGDWHHARSLVSFFDRLDQGNILPKTVLFTVDPRNNDLFVSIAGSFQGGTVPGRIQFGPAWWFNDTREGIIDHLNALAGGGLLSRFIGMVTDSRSILSFTRHDYFRRILCNLLGEEVERGEIPDDTELLGGMIRDICYRNAIEYFALSI